MANPITVQLPADLPVNWTEGQIVAPSGSAAGLSEQHGYNYLMQQVNNAQTAASQVGAAVDAMGKIIPSLPGQSGVLVENGSAQSPSWSNYDSNKLTLGGTTSATAPGVYNATFAPKTGYTWADGTTATKTVTWSILSKSVRTCRVVVGTSTAGWTAADCDYLCDGTNDEVEIQTAIDEVEAAGGGEVRILSGTYDIQFSTERVSSEGFYYGVVVSSTNLNIVGEGADTTLKAVRNSSISDLDLKSIIVIEDGAHVIRDLSLIMDPSYVYFRDAETAGVMIWGAYSVEATISNVLFRNLWHGIRASGFKSISVYECTIGNGDGTISQDPGWCNYGLTIDCVVNQKASGNCSISDNTFRCYNGALVQNVYDASITNNYVEYVGGGISIEGTYYEADPDWSIPETRYQQVYSVLGNRLCHNAQTQAPTKNYAIHLDSCLDTVVSNNLIDTISKLSTYQERFYSIVMENYNQRCMVVRNIIDAATGVRDNSNSKFASTNIVEDNLVRS